MEPVGEVCGECVHPGVGYKAAMDIILPEGTKLYSAAQLADLERKNELLRNLTECECGDGFTEHDKGLCVNCVSTVTAPYSLRVAELEAEVSAWRARFTEYQYRPQDDCVALN